MSLNASNTRSLQHIADSLAGYDPNSLAVVQAQAFISELVSTVQGVEHLALRSALGRVLAQPVHSPIDVPAHDNSAMDGYALRSSDLRHDGPTALKVVGTGLAGSQFEGVVASGQCVRITTGAVMPQGLDTVVPQEFTTLQEDVVRIEPGVVRAGDNRRLAGEDLALGAVALPAGRLINRELSLLEFNQRVLAQAQDPTVPLLERLRFLCISSSNLDEFFEIRVAGIKQLQHDSPRSTSPDGLTPAQQLTAIHDRATRLVAAQYACLNRQLLPALASAGIVLLRREELDDDARAWLAAYFEREIEPVLSPLALDPSRPFPRIQNKSLNFVVRIEGEDAYGREATLAIVQAPR
ncbi:MAG: hypothetical protein EBS39_13155, partial [Gammaproteobacteria bacterium]|nr:hypothetical protein [Gammaproteobacteria bacterium]